MSVLIYVKSGIGCASSCVHGVPPPSAIMPDKWTQPDRGVAQIPQQLNSVSGPKDFAQREMRAVVTLTLLMLGNAANTVALIR
jgi:hypothetical protein